MDSMNDDESDSDSSSDSSLPSHESIMGSIGDSLMGGLDEGVSAFDSMFPPRTINYSDTQSSQPNTPTASSTVVGGVDWKSYATDPSDIQHISNIYNSLPEFTSPQDIDNYINTKFPKSPLTGDIIYNEAQKNGADPKGLVARLQQDSGLGTTGVGAKTKNPGNYGNTGTSTKTFPTWQQGVAAVAGWMKKNVVPTANAAPLSK